jgi:predicted nucleic acid-binding protein
MLVVDTSAFVSLGTIDTLEIVLDEFDVQTTELVLDELANTADYDDTHGEAAESVLSHRESITVHEFKDHEFRSSRIDPGEGSCAMLANELEADFLLTDDLRALPELQTLSDARVAISPIVLKALVTRDVIDSAEAIDRLERLAADRSWLGAPIYRRAQNLFETDSSG